MLGEIGPTKVNLTLIVKLNITLVSDGAVARVSELSEEESCLRGSEDDVNFDREGIVNRDTDTNFTTPI